MTIDNRNTDYEDGDEGEIVTLRATDDGGLISEDVSAQIAVLNLNDNAPKLVDGSSVAFQLSGATEARGCLFEEESKGIAYAEESNAADQDCVLSNFATDADGSSLSYSIIQDPAGLFNIDSQSGAIALSKKVDFEVDDADKDITLRISDGVFDVDYIFTMRPVALDETPDWTFRSEAMKIQKGSTLFLPRYHVNNDDDTNALHPLWIKGLDEFGREIKGYRVPASYFGYRDGDGTALRYTLAYSISGKYKMAQYETSAGVNQFIYSPDADPDNPLSHDPGANASNEANVFDANTGEPVAKIGVGGGQVLDPAIPNNFTPFGVAGVNKMDNPFEEITDVEIEPEGNYFVVASTGGYFAMYETGANQASKQYIGSEYVGHDFDASQHSGALTVDITYGNSGDGINETRVALCTGYYQSNGVTQNGLFKVLMPTGRSWAADVNDQWDQVGESVAYYQDESDSNYRCGIKLSDDGTYVAVGNPNYKDPDTGLIIGAIYVYANVNQSFTVPSGWQLIHTFYGYPEKNELLGLDGSFDIGGLRRIYENGNIYRQEVVRLAIRNKALGHAYVFELDLSDYSWDLVGEKVDANGARYSFDCGVGIEAISISLSGNQIVCSQNADKNDDGFDDAAFKVAFYDEVTDEWVDSTAKFLSPNNDRSEVSLLAENNVATSQVYSSSSASVYTGGTDAPQLTQNGLRLALSYDYGKTDLWYWNDYPYSEQRSYSEQLNDNTNYYNQRHLPLSLDDVFDTGEAGNVSALHSAMSDNGKVIVKVRKNSLSTSGFGAMEGSVYKLLVRGFNMDSWDGYLEQL
jgi:hypothetical protein